MRDRISRRASADARTPGQDWSLIGRGFIIALLGAAGVMLYILGVSNWFVGSNSLVVVNLIGATVLFAVFLRQLPAYLDCLEAIPKALETQRETYAAPPIQE